MGKIKIGWLLSVRQESTRFSEKSIKPFFNNLTIPQYLINRLIGYIKSLPSCISEKYIQYISFIIPESNRNSTLSHSLVGGNIFYGDQDDLIKRNLDCALENSLEYVVRITCDDPFKDFDSAFLMIEYAIKNNLDFITNEHDGSYWIEGTTVEIYKTSFLRWLYFNSWTSFQREHIEFKSVLKYRGYKVKTKYIAYLEELNELTLDVVSKNLSNYSVTVDTEFQFNKAIDIAKKIGINSSYEDLKLLTSHTLLKNSPIGFNNTKTSHFVRLVNAINTRTTKLELINTIEMMSSDLRGSKTQDYVTLLELKFAEIFNCKYAVAMSNGTVTLENSLRAVGICPGDEVILPDLTMAAPAMAVIAVGAIPVFADVDKLTFQICVESIKRNITPKTKAIIAVSLFGGLPDLNSINNICIENNIRLIEDNAESMLSSYNHEIYGLVGDISSFSFQATKHITGFEGGICLTNSYDYALSLRRYSAVGYSTLKANKTHVDKNIIQNPDFQRHLYIGTNSRLSNASASIALSQLENVHHLVNVRKYCSEMYNEICLKHINVCKIQHNLPNTLSSFWGFAFILIDKDKWMYFRKAFIDNGGLPFYAAWKNISDEPAFTPSKGGYEIEKRLGEKNYKSYCNSYKNRDVSNARWIQERMIILRTNLWNTNIVELQCRILDDALISIV